MKRDPDVDYRMEAIPTHLLDSLPMTPGAFFPTEDFAPVLALTITRRRELDNLVLVCVRDRSTNVTHQNVLSSPTIRIRSFTTGLADLLDGNRGHWRGLTPNWLLKSIDQLFREKFGVDLKESLDYRVNAVAAWQGHSVIGRRKLDLVTEALTMVNVHLEVVDSAAQALETSPRSAYSSASWITWEEHATMVRTRDAATLSDGRQNGTPIVYGLCTYSTASMLEAAAFNTARATAESASLV